MIIIGHRGAAGLAPENTIDSMWAALNSDVDMIEFDVQLTRDAVPVVVHDTTLNRTHKIAASVQNLSYSELRLLTKDQPVPTLQEVLDKFSRRILLNIELKSRGAGKVVLEILQSRQPKQPQILDNVLLSSFFSSELIALRWRNKQINLGLLHRNNPFVFIAYERYLKLSAVGFHRLHTNRLATEIARKTGLFSYVYTVNRPKTALRLARQNYDGVVTNYPDRIAKELS